MVEAGSGCESLVMLGGYEISAVVLAEGFEDVLMVWDGKLDELAVAGTGSLAEVVFDDGLDA